MNAVVSTIKDRAKCPHHTVQFGKCQTCGYDYHGGVTMAEAARAAVELSRAGVDLKFAKGGVVEPEPLQDREVKPDAEDWWTAKVIVARAGIRAYPEYLVRVGDTPYFRAPDGSGFPAAEIRICHVIIDADGNNVEPQRLSWKFDEEYDSHRHAIQKWNEAEERAAKAERKSAAAGVRVRELMGRERREREHASNERRHLKACIAELKGENERLRGQA